MRSEFSRPAFPTEQFFSHYLAANHAEKIAAIAPVVGGIADPFYQKFHPAEPVSVLICKGRKIHSCRMTVVRLGLLAWEIGQGDWDG